MSRCTAFAMALFDGKYMTSYLMVIVMFTLSLTSCEVFAKIIQCQVFTLKMTVKFRVEEQDLRHFSGKVLIHIGEIFRILNYRGTYVCAKGNVHTWTQYHAKALQQKCSVSTFDPENYH